MKKLYKSMSCMALCAVLFMAVPSVPAQAGGSSVQSKARAKMKAPKAVLKAAPQASKVVPMDVVEQVNVLDADGEVDPDLYLGRAYIMENMDSIVAALFPDYIEAAKKGKARSLLPVGSKGNNVTRKVRLVDLIEIEDSDLADFELSVTLDTEKLDANGDVDGAVAGFVFGGPFSADEEVPCPPEVYLNGCGKPDVTIGFWTDSKGNDCKTYYKNGEAFRTVCGDGDIGPACTYDYATNTLICEMYDDHGRTTSTLCPDGWYAPEMIPPGVTPNMPGCGDGEGPGDKPEDGPGDEPNPKEECPELAPDPDTGLVDEEERQRRHAMCSGDDQN